MQFDRKKFFDIYREQMGDLSQEEVDSVRQILDRAEPDPRVLSLRQLAYMIATARWETRRFERLREVGGHDYLRQYDGKGGNRKGTEDYYNFRGGGWCHTTFRDNYRRASGWCKNAGITVDLTAEPERILEPDINYEVMVTGHLTGGFTGFKLSDYINDQKVEYRQARLVINPGELYIADGKWKAKGKTEADRRRRKQQCIEAVDTIVKWAKATEAALRAADLDALPVVTTPENTNPTEAFQPKAPAETTVTPQLLETLKTKAGAMTQTAIGGLSLSTLLSWFAQNRFLTLAVFLIIVVGFVILFRKTFKIIFKRFWSLIRTGA